jgi:adenylate cyclase
VKFPSLPRWSLGPLLGAVLTTGLGLLCLFSNLGKPLERLSYDLPFPLRKNLSTSKVAIIYLDEDAARALGQPLNLPWDRRIFAKLLDRLAADGAKLVCFDIIFSTPSSDPAADEEFAAAMVRHGGAILGGDYREHEQLGVQVSTVEKATPGLRKAQAGWGLLIFRPIDPDGAVRQFSLAYEGFPTLSATAASLAGAKLPAPNSKPPPMSLNYYGPPGEAFEGVSIADALRPDGVPPDFFRGRTVFVGGRYASGSLQTAKDEFGNPYSRWGRRFSPGVEIHATAFLNLLRGEWLRRVSFSTECAILLATGLLFGAGLSLLRPHWAFLATFLGGLGLATAACWLVWQQHLWTPWLIPIGVQLPLALGWSVGRQYFVEQRRRVALRRAFGCYLSPEMADRISNSSFDLQPGGTAVEATVVFTDLENFTTFSETLPVEDVSRILIAYFTQTTDCILKNKGTIIKYIGDAVMATWNAPMQDSDHARHAVIAAWALAEASKREVCGHTLRTRVGIHTGRALAGNLGSPFRFDYTLIGDTVNFASRLEGINKYLGTQILLSEATASHLNGEFVTRPLGRFVLKGKTRWISLHELLGPRTSLASKDLEPEWRSTFQSGVEAYAEGHLDVAVKFMRQTIEIRAGGDGPSEFYLRKIAEIDKHGRPAEWTGSVFLDEK